MTLRPFFPYFGSKWRAVPRYPEPRFEMIVEPFAGAPRELVRRVHGRRTRGTRALRGDVRSNPQKHYKHGAQGLDYAHLGTNDAPSAAGAGAASA